MKRLSTVICITTCVLISVLTSAPASGEIINGGFEDSPDLTGWVCDGSVFKRDYEMSRDFLPPIAPDWAPREGNYFASIWTTDQQGRDGLMSTSFTASAGEFLSFDYFFDFGDVALHPDLARAVLAQPSWVPVTLFEHNTPGHDLLDDQNIGWTTVLYELPEDGEYSLTFETEDALVGGFESILGIDNVVVTPEPSCALLLGAGALSVLSRRRRAD